MTRSQADISKIILVYKLPLQSVMLGLGLKTKVFGLGLEAQVFSLVNIPVINVLNSQSKKNQLLLQYVVISV